MRKSDLLLGAAMALAMTGTAVAGPQGTYVGIAGGAVFIEESPITTQLAPAVPVFAGNLDFDTGWAVMLNAGERWGHWRLELEGAYRDNDGTRTLLPTIAPVEVTEWSLMVNAFYDIPMSPKWTFSLGLGLGVDFVDYEATGLTPQWDEDTVAAAQLLAQLSYAVSSRTELYVDYHYTVLDDPVFERATAPIQTATIDVNKHTIGLGLRYDLIADEEPVAPPPPPPPPPPVLKQFIVFFGFAKCTLTPEAQSVINEAATTAKSQGTASILVTGHTDTVGGTSANQKLSECRANRVKNALEALGIPGQSITAIGKGETELLIQTGDSVKEPQNRRATIDLQ